MPYLLCACTNPYIYTHISLQGSQPDVEVWQRILQVRTLVLNPEDDPIMWIKFANLCRKSERMPLAEKTINSLLSPERVRVVFLLPFGSILIFTKSRLHEQHTKAPPNVVYAQLKYMWATGAREESLNFLRQFSSSLSKDLQAEGEVPSHPGVPRHQLSGLSKLLARCYFKTGEWQIKLTDDWGSVGVFDSFHFTTFLTFICREM